MTTVATLFLIIAAEGPPVLAHLKNGELNGLAYPSLAQATTRATELGEGWTPMAARHASGLWLVGWTGPVALRDRDAGTGGPGPVVGVGSTAAEAHDRAVKAHPGWSFRGGRYLPASEAALVAWEQGDHDAHVTMDGMVRHESELGPAGPLAPAPGAKLRSEQTKAAVEPARVVVPHWKATRVGPGSEVSLEGVRLNVDWSTTRSVGGYEARVEIGGPDRVRGERAFQRGQVAREDAARIARQAIVAEMGRLKLALAMLDMLDSSVKEEPKPEPAKKPARRARR